MTEKKALQQIVLGFPDFEQWDLRKQYELIGWSLHTVMKQEYFIGRDLRRCLKHLDVTIGFKLLPSRAAPSSLQ